MERAPSRSVLVQLNHEKVSAAGSVPDAVLKRAGLPKRPRAARRREKIGISAHFKQIGRGFLLCEARLMDAVMTRLNTCTVCCSFLQHWQASYLVVRRSSTLLTQNSPQLSWRCEYRIVRIRAGFRISLTMSRGGSCVVLPSTQLSTLDGPNAKNAPQPPRPRSRRSGRGAL